MVGMTLGLVSTFGAIAALKGVMEAQGDFEIFVAARQGPLLRLAMVLCGDHWLAQDVVANVLGHAFERWDRISTVQDPNAYVRRMVVNEYISLHRRWSRARPVDPSLLIELAGASYDEQRADATELAGRLAGLSPNQRAVIVLRYYEDLTDAAIGEVLGCRTATVRSHASRALHALRLDLNRAGEKDTSRKEQTC